MASPRIVSDSIVIATSPGVIFAILADPVAHLEIDGSDSVQGVTSTRTGRGLVLGDRFGMNMKIGLPYRIRNTVVEYDENRLIGWQHFARHTWRYELDEFEPGRTRVTESWDWSRSPYALVMELAGFPDRNRRAIAASLPKLKALAETRAATAVREQRRQSAARDARTLAQGEPEPDLDNLAEHAARQHLDLD